MKAANTMAAAAYLTVLVPVDTFLTWRLGTSRDKLTDLKAFSRPLKEVSYLHEANLRQTRAVSYQRTATSTVEVATRNRTYSGLDNDINPKKAMSAVKRIEKNVNWGTRTPPTLVNPSRISPEASLTEQYCPAGF